jgi:hypothetical protein
MMATQLLREQHRQIQQKLALLEAQAHDCERELAALVVELNAHLAAEETAYYPRAEQVLGHELAEQRLHHERVRERVARTGPALASLGRFRQLFELAEAFKAHTHVEERAVHPSLESHMGGRQLEALGTQVAAVHSAALAASVARGERRH